LSIVTVLLEAEKPELISKKTLSVGPGTTDGKDTPPEVVRQWLISVQFPLPPTQ